MVVVIWKRPVLTRILNKETEFYINIVTFASFSSNSRILRMCCSVVAFCPPRSMPTVVMYSKYARFFYNWISKNNKYHTQLKRNKSFHFFLCDELLKRLGSYEIVAMLRWSKPWEVTLSSRCDIWHLLGFTRCNNLRRFLFLLNYLGPNILT